MMLAAAPAALGLADERPPLADAAASHAPTPAAQVVQSAAAAAAPCTPAGVAEGEAPSRAMLGGADCLQQLGQTHPPQEAATSVFRSPQPASTTPSVAQATVVPPMMMAVPQQLQPQQLQQPQGADPTAAAAAAAAAAVAVHARGVLMSRWRVGFLVAM